MWGRGRQWGQAGGAARGAPAAAGSGSATGAPPQNSGEEEEGKEEGRGRGRGRASGRGRSGERERSAGRGGGGGGIGEEGLIEGCSWTLGPGLSLSAGGLPEPGLHDGSASTRSSAPGHERDDQPGGAAAALCGELQDAAKGARRYATSS